MYTCTPVHLYTCTPAYCTHVHPQVANHLYTNAKVIGGHEVALQFLEDNKEDFKIRRTRYCLPCTVHFILALYTKGCLFATHTSFLVS